MTKQWTPQTWTEFPVEQQPDWPDSAELETVLKEISELPPLVFAGEARTLQDLDWLADSRSRAPL